MTAWLRSFIFLLVSSAVQCKSVHTGLNTDFTLNHETLRYFVRSQRMKLCLVMNHVAVPHLANIILITGTVQNLNRS